MRWPMIAACALLLPACSDKRVIVDPVPTGGLAITFATAGSLLDSDGYIVGIDGATGVAIGINGSTTKADLEAGDHHVAVSGLASNCTLAGDNPRTATVVAGDTITVAFEVTCVAPPCEVRGTADVAARQDGSSSLPADHASLAAGCARRSPGPAVAAGAM